ncbi:PCI domain-containing protein [Cantharellus anzutake]|uniref:PCI domain-containing protein n=1 Tax=Cantharellus anzutake TaxID=1750568 RepID=UPI001904DA3C|nr:PCI domain-containing protein [Cantharellus anzutake]KAF8320521.1 PCI domain-containing protein [Cantharellus anzutake]
MEDDDMEYLEAAGSDDDYGLEYTDEDDEGVAAGADMENQYYTAKALKEDDQETALKAFQAIVAKETEPTEWGFKALKQQTKLLFLVLRRPHEALRTYTKLLTYTKSVVTRNYSEKSINGILDYVGDGGKKGKGRKVAAVAANQDVDVEVLQKFYEVTKASLEDTKNDRLSLKTNLKLAKLWLDRKEFGRLNALIRELHQSVEGGASGDTGDQSRGTLLLEIYALEIQMYNEMRNYKKLKEIYNATLEVRSAIPHPRIMGVIRECGGKMWMGEKQWARASTDFFESFRNYDESGSPQRIQVLKYLVLANMLMGSDINPFDSQETKPYKNDPEITAMTDLVGAYQRREVHEAEKILRDNKATIMDDPFIRFYIGDLLRTLRTQYLIDLIRPYTRLELSFLAKQLNVDKEEVEDLLIGLILEGKVKGRIDQVGARLQLDSSRTLEKRRYAALEKWTEGLEKVHGSIVGRFMGSGGTVSDTRAFSEFA